jgi:CHAT domain-containing protein
MYSRPPVTPDDDAAALAALDKADGYLADRLDLAAIAQKASQAQARGQLAFFKNDFDECLKWYAESDRLCQISGDCAAFAFQLTQQALPLHELARRSDEPVRWEQAAMRLMWARELFGSMNLRPRELDTYRLHASLLFEQARAMPHLVADLHAQAETSLEAGAAIIDEFVVGHRDEDVRKRQANQEGLARQHMGFLRMGMDHYLCESRRADAALLWLERMKSRSLLDAMTAMNEPPQLPAEADPVLRARLLETETALGSLKGNDPLSRKRRNKVEKQLKEILDELAMKPETAGYASLRRGHAVSWPEWRKQLAHQSQRPEARGRTVVSIHFVWPTSPNSPIRLIVCRPEWDMPRSKETNITRARIESFLEEVRLGGLRMAIGKDGGRNWRRGFSGLLDPLAEWTKMESDIICLIPHEELHGLPLHALDVEGYPLITRNAVFRAPSAAILRLNWERRQRSDSRMGTGAAVFACPGPEGEPGYLPGAKKEAAFVAQLLGTETLSGDRGTRDAFFAAIANARIIHFAGHGIEAQDGMNRGLKLAGDERVLAFDFYSRRLVADIVTLSGCATGKSQWTKGDEAVGLIPGILNAGVHSVLATQWEVSDEAALQLMRSFYQSICATNPQPNADAFRDAVDELRHKVAAGHLHHFGPADWSAFMLTGDWA